MSKGKNPPGKSIGDLRSRLGLDLGKPGGTSPLQRTTIGSRQTGTDTPPQAQADPARRQATFPSKLEGTQPDPPSGQTARPVMPYGQQTPPTEERQRKLQADPEAEQTLDEPTLGQSEPRQTIEPASGSQPPFEPGNSATELSPLNDPLLEDFDPGQRSRKLTMTVAVAVIGIISLFFGFHLGNIRMQRRMINQKIRDAATIMERLQPVVAQVTPLLQDIKDAQPNIVNEELARKLGSLEADLRFEDVIGQNPLLGPRITGNLTRFVAQVNALAHTGKRHSRLTLQTHKEYLDAAKESTEALQKAMDLFVAYQPRANPNEPPPEGTLVKVVGEPERRGREVIVPVKTMAGREQEANIDHMVYLNNAQVIASGGPTVLNMYSERIRDLQLIADDLTKITSPMMGELRKEATKRQVIAF